MFHVKHAGGPDMISYDELVAAGREFGVELLSSQLHHLEIYERQILAWAPRVNLVSKGDTRHLRSRHFTDSISVLPYLPKARHSLLDLGSGGGFPGIPIKIVRPDIQVTLLESGRMKGLFLSQVVKLLDLEGLLVWKGRAEQISERAGLNTQDVVVCRAVGSLSLLWQLAKPFLKPTGRLLAFKGPKAQEEWDSEPIENVSVTFHPTSVPITGRARIFVEICSNL